MAASSTNTIRVRLCFDYPPPAVSDFRMCWVLVDLNKCLVVADLASIIRKKFDYSRRNILNLFIEDCYLPHTESIYVVRDNDNIRVKVDSTTQVNGLDTSSGNPRKRGRDTGNEETAENGMSVERKKKKKKRKHEESESNHVAPAADSESNTTKQKKKKEKKKRKMEEKEVTTKQTASTKEAPPTAAQPVKNTKKAPVPTSVSINGKAKTQNVSSTDSSDSSSEFYTPPLKTLPKTPSSTSAAPVASKVTPKGKVTAMKPQPPPSSSSDSSTSSDEASRVKPPLKKTHLTKPSTTPTSTTPTTSKVEQRDKTTPSRLQPGHPSPVPTPSAPAQRPIALGSTLAVKKGSEKPETSDSDSSEEEITLVIKQPLQGTGMGMGLARAVGDSNLRGRGRGSPRGMERERGRGRGQGQRLGEGRGGTGPRGGGRGGRGEDGGAQGDQGFYFNYETGQQQQQQPPPPPSYQSDSLTNNSVVLRNPAESGPKRDYSVMPQLASPPPVGQRIAFKLLELTENYTPEVSEYKEGRIISFDYSTKQIELQLLSASQGHVEPGKFDLVYQNADGSESVEYAVSRGSRVTERWDSLLEPRLILEN